MPISLVAGGRGDTISGRATGEHPNRFSELDIKTAHYGIATPSLTNVRIDCMCLNAAEKGQQQN